MSVNIGPSLTGPRLTQAVDDWLRALELAVDNRDEDRIGDLFTDDCWWSDLLSFTWDFQTYRAADVAPMLAQLSQTTLPTVSASTRTSR